MNHFKRDLVLAGCAFAVLGYFTASAQQPSFRADEFTDFVGLNASPFNRYLDSGPYAGAGTQYPPELFFDLGVRHYRTGLFNDLVKPDTPD